MLFTSTELPEFVHLCDRVLVFYRGRVAGELGRGQLATHTLLEAINTGVVDASPAVGASSGQQGGSDHVQ